MFENVASPYVLVFNSVKTCLPKYQSFIFQKRLLSETTKMEAEEKRGAPTLNTFISSSIASYIQVQSELIMSHPKINLSLNNSGNKNVNTLSIF